MKVYAIIPAGGQGKRIRSSLPKQFIKIENKELIYYTLKLFYDSPKINRIVIPVNSSYKSLLEEIVKKNNFQSKIVIVEGGTERQDSVYNALKSLKADDNDIIVVHDAARPLIPKEVLNNSINEAEKSDAAVVAIKARDTLLKGAEFVQKYIDRSETYYVQTPQVFKYSILMKAMNKAKSENFYGTDESMLVKRIGQKIKIVEGSSLNFKITEQSDLEILKIIIGNNVNLHK